MTSCVGRAAELVEVELVEETEDDDVLVLDDVKLLVEVGGDDARWRPMNAAAMITITMTTATMAKDLEIARDSMFNFETGNLQSLRHIYIFGRQH